MRARLVPGILVSAALLLPAGASAQLRLSIGGGLTPQLASEESVGTGYHGQVGLEVTLPLVPFALRADGAWHRFPLDGVDGDYDVVSGTLNGIFRLPTPGVTPYFLVGAGAYQLRNDPDLAIGSADKTYLGFNAGAGIRLAGRLFAEARLHSTIDLETVLVPITLGFRL